MTALDTGLAATRAFRPRVRSSLVMTDYMLLTATGLAALFAVDPLGWKLALITVTKHLPALLFLATWILSFVADQMRLERPSARGVLRILAPVIALAVFITVGSIFGRVSNDTRNSFLTAGVYMLSAPMAASLLLRSADPHRLVRGVVWLLGLASLVVAVQLVLYYGVREVHHELEFLVTPLALVFVFMQPRRRWHWMALISYMLTALLFKKNTGYLTGLLIVAYVIAFYAWPRWRRRPGLMNAARAYLLLCLTLVAGLVAAYIVFHRETYLPTGNTEFRTFTYLRAWNRFLGSPIWGTGFTSAGTEEFTLFDTGRAHNILPTHSDVLDIAANGGLIGLALLVGGLWRVAHLAWKWILRPDRQSHAMAPYAHAFAGISLSAIVTYMFNPIFLQPDKSLLMWTSLGLLVGIALLARDESEAQSTVSNR